MQNTPCDIGENLFAANVLPNPLLDSTTVTRAFFSEILLAVVWLLLESDPGDFSRSLCFFASVGLHGFTL